MEIRKFREADLPQVLQLCNEVREHHRRILNGYFIKQNDDFEKTGFLESLEANGKMLALLAVEENLIKGLLLAEIKHSPHLEKPEIGFVHNFVVGENFRGQGIGRKLMQAFMADCRNRGIQEVKLGVFNANRGAYKFYEDFGFVPQEQKMSLMLK